MSFTLRTNESATQSSCWSMINSRSARSFSVNAGSEIFVSGRLIPFLEELKNYHYLSLFVYFYLVFSILLDVSNLFIKLSKKSVFLKGEIWQIEQTLFGKELKKYDLSSKELNIRLKHGFLYDYFGLNQIIWEKDNVTVIETAYFFPYGKNKNIINNLLRR